MIEIPDDPTPTELREAAKRADVYAAHMEADARRMRQLADSLRVRAHDAERVPSATPSGTVTP